MTWPGPQLLSWGRGMKRKGQGWSWGGRGKGETLRRHSPTPRKHLCSLGPPMYPGPLRFHLVLPLALVAPSFAPLDFFSPSRFSGRIMLWASPQTAPPHEGATSAFPALPLLQAHLFPLWDRIFDSPPSSPPSPWGGKKKKKHQFPREGQQTLGTGRRGARRTIKEEGSQALGGQGGGHRQGESSAAPALCHPCPLSRGLQHNQRDRCVWGQV